MFFTKRSHAYFIATGATFYSFFIPLTRTGSSSILRETTAVRIVRKLPTNMRNSGWSFSPGAGEMPSGQRGRKKSYCCFFIPLTATRSSPTLGKQLPYGFSKHSKPLQKNVTSNCSSPCPKNMLHQSMMSITSP